MGHSTDGRARGERLLNHCVRFAVAIGSTMSLQYAMAQEVSPTMRAQKFVDAHVAKLKPLEKEASVGWWDANISGKDEDFKRKEEAQNRIDEALANHDTFDELKRIRDKGGITDSVL